MKKKWLLAVLVIFLVVGGWLAYRWYFTACCEPPMPTPTDYSDVTI